MTEGASPGVNQNNKYLAGGASRWAKVVGYEVEPAPADEQVEWRSHDYLPDLDSEQVPQDREERERWNRERLKRLIETEGQREASDNEWHY